MSENLSGYEAVSQECRIYNRDAANEVGFVTTKLDLYEANALSRFCEKLFKDGFERGRESLAAQIRSQFPQEAGK